MALVLAALAGLPRSGDLVLPFTAGCSCGRSRGGSSAGGLCVS
jgi:hypothetical protein